MAHSKQSSGQILPSFPILTPLCQLRHTFSMCSRRLAISSVISWNPLPLLVVEIWCILSQSSVKLWYVSIFWPRCGNYGACLSCASDCPLLAASCSEINLFTHEVSLRYAVALRWDKSAANTPKSLYSYIQDSPRWRMYAIERITFFNQITYFWMVDRNSFTVTGGSKQRSLLAVLCIVIRYRGLDETQTHACWSILQGNEPFFHEEVHSHL